jgi:hypothetical protein
MVSALCNAASVAAHAEALAERGGRAMGGDLCGGS